MQSTENTAFDEPVCFDEALIRRYDGRGPRYTSYPTALQFDSAFDASEYRRHARLSNRLGLPLSLYLHIPFCRTLCYYCGCNKIVTRNQERVQRYLADLYTEIDLQSELFDIERTVEQLHFGGGTPTYLDKEQLADLMQKLGERFRLDDSDDRQFSIEVDPRTVDNARIAELAGLGFNRLSLGIQDFDPKVQALINRHQSVESVATLVDAARHNGFESISFDLIYGLPHQNVASFDRTLDSVLAMRPERFAVYNYAHLPERFKGQRMIPAEEIPDAQTKLDLIQRTIERLASAGYVYIGMDHFALPEDDLVKARHDGTLQRNFQGYSTHRHCDLVGLGVSAISSIGNAYSQNSISTAEYQEQLEVGHLPVSKGIVVDADDQLRGAAIQALMCFDELRFDEFDARHACRFRDYFRAELDALAPMVADDLLTISDTAIHIRPKGRMLLRTIAMAFDRYSTDPSADQRFSKAI